MKGWACRSYEAVRGFLSSTWQVRHGLLAPLYTGSTTYPLLAFDPSKAMQVISRERCLVAIGVSTMIQALLAHPDVAHYDLSSLKMVGSGGAPVPPVLMEQVKTQLGADVGICFGQAEVLPHHDARG